MAHIPALLLRSLVSMALAEEPLGGPAVPRSFKLAASTHLSIPVGRGGSGGLVETSESVGV